MSDPHLYEKSAPDQVICVECGETIMYVEPGAKRRRLYPLRCWSCIDQLDRSGVLAREGYTREEARYVL